MPHGTSPTPSKIILASASPRRRALLADLNLSFDVEPSPFDEASVHASTPEELVMALARGKALAVAERHPGALVIGADTAVIIDGDVLENPGMRKTPIGCFAALQAAPTGSSRASPFATWRRGARRSHTNRPTSLLGPSATTRSQGTSRQGSPWIKPAPTASRGMAPSWCRVSTVAISM